MHKYKAITEWLFSQVPVYQSQGITAYKPDLKKMENFVQYLGNPHHQFFIHSHRWKPMEKDQQHT